MKKSRGLFLIFMFLMAFINLVSASDNGIFLYNDLYTVEEYEKLEDMDFSVLARTSDFLWKDQNGDSPKIKQERALPAYVLTASSDSCVAGFASFPREPIDAYDYRSISFAVRIKSSESVETQRACSFLFSLASGEKRAEYSADISYNKWNIVSFDVSHFKHRKSINEIIIGFVGDDNSLPLESIELSGPYVKEDEKPKMAKFMSDGLAAFGTELEIIDKGTENEALRVHLNSQRVNISGISAPPYMREDCNSVRIVLTNESMLNSISFNYDYFDPKTGVISSATRTASIEPYSEMSSCYINTGDVNMISNFSVILDSAAQGIFTIHSISPVALYEGYEGNSFGEITLCKKDASGKNLLIDGSIFHNYLTSHDDHTLVCYMLSSSESLEEALGSGRTPVGELKMSSRFRFEIKLGALGEHAMVSKYVVASRSKDGEITPLTAPFSTMAEFSVSDRTKGSENIKGIEYEDISVAVDCGVGYAIVDVLLDKLVSRGQSGHLYSLGKEFIYFDAQYVSALDKKVKNLYASGCKVYLRLLISGDTEKGLLPYAASVDINHALYLAVDIRDEDARRHFYGTVDFLSSRYSKMTNGKISGLILGKSVDIPDLYNGSAKEGIVDYAKMLATAFEIMARCAAEALDRPEVILPVSDVKNGILGYDSEQLLVSFCRYIAESGGFDFTLMLEGTKAHDPLNMNEDYYSLQSFEGMMKNLSFASENAPDSYIYLFSSEIGLSVGELSALYIYSYYSVMFSEKAAALVLSLQENEGVDEIIRNLSYLVKYIDTEKNKHGELCHSALKVFSADSWEELISGYDSSLIGYRILRETESLSSFPENISGKYSLWDFSTAFGVQEWFEGNNCTSVYIDSNADGERALCAVMEKTGTYSDMVYNYEFSDDISLMQYLGFDIFVDDESGALYEISVLLGGDDHRIETYKAVKGGERDEIIIDTRLHNEMKKLDYIRISIRHINEGDDGKYKLYLHSVNAYSDKMSDGELENAITRARALARNASMPTASLSVSKPKYEFIIAIAVIVVLGVAMVGFYERKQR